MGSCKSLLCDQEVRIVRNWAIEKVIFITVAHIPGILNVEADQASRKSELRIKWNKSVCIWNKCQTTSSFCLLTTPKSCSDACYDSQDNLSLYCVFVSFHV